MERELIDMKVALTEAITQWAGLEDNMAQLTQTIIGHSSRRNSYQFQELWPRLTCRCR